MAEIIPFDLYMVSAARESLSVRTSVLASMSLTQKENVSLSVRVTQADNLSITSKQALALEL